MEKLEKKMYEIVKNETVLSHTKSSIVSKLIASDVKDIAIAYNYWRIGLVGTDLETSYEVQPGCFRFRNKTDDELFLEFITNYYS